MRGCGDLSRKGSGLATRVDFASVAMTMARPVLIVDVVILVLRTGERNGALAKRIHSQKLQEST